MEAVRAESGRFARRGVRDARTLYAILRAVAEAAIADRPQADPRKVTTRQWRDARHLCEPEFGHIPLPQEIQRQLAKLNGEVIPFPELLQITFGKRGSIKHVQTQQQAEARSEAWMSDRHVLYALRYVVRSLASEGDVIEEMAIEPRPYERERRRLIAEDKQKREYGGHLAELLPTYRQITTYAGTWDRALEIAQLAPRPRTQGARGRGRLRPSVPVPEAIVRFYELVGVLPTEAKLQRFRRDYGFAVRGLRSRPFAEFLPAALDLIAARDDLPTPRPYEETRRLKVTWPRPEYDFDPTHPTKIRKYTTPQIIEWTIKYIQTLGPGEAGSQDGWRDFARNHPGCPSTGAMTNHGGLDAFIERSRHPHALELAEAEYQAQLAAEREEQIRADPEKPQAQAVLAAMEELGGTFIRHKDLAAHIGWDPRTLVYWLGILRTAGKIELVDARVGRKSYRYQLTGINLSEDELERRSIEAEARRPKPRQIMELLAEHGRMSGHELADELVAEYSGLMIWVRMLKKAGYIEPLLASAGSPRGYRLTESGRELLARSPSPAENTAS